MKYEPRASQFERDCCSYAILADLKHAEACIKARDEEIALHNDFMAFLHAEIGKLECCCENGEHKSTPPMMWPELIGCIVKKACRSRDEEIERLTNAMKVASSMAGQYWLEAKLMLADVVAGSECPIKYEDMFPAQD